MKLWHLTLLLAAALCVSQWMLWEARREVEQYRHAAKIWRENFDFCKGGMRP